ncbi:GMC oxidoreductase [Kutzneria albida]|uniref:GMC oxidoreductase n=1 Tax=Kutzneria albida TaxID=43357 RepID=UPI0009E05474|nr:GMC oxidoreductase [Kutzneria albida]
MAEVSRRRFLALAAAAPIGLRGGGGAHVPAIVVGSGFGGSVAALRLGQAGVDVLLLERGKLWPHDDHAQVFGSESSIDRRMLWFQLLANYPGLPAVPMIPYPGVMQVDVQPGITVLAASCVGGGSVVYTGVTLQPPRRYFERLYPSGLSYTELDRVYFPRVRAMLSAQTVPEEVYNSAPFTHTRVFDAQFATAGLPVERTPSTFDWQVVRRELAGQVRPSAIVGESSFGNSNGAKHDLTRNYLPAALATGHVRLGALHEVTSIRREAGRYALAVTRRDEDGLTVEQLELTCDRLVLATGSINTTRLLVAARDSGALPGLNEHVGTNWGSNGDAFVFRPYTGPVGPSQAAPIVSTAMVDQGYPVPIRAESAAVSLPGQQPVLHQLSIAVDMDNRGVWRSGLGGQVGLNWQASQSDPALRSALALSERVGGTTGVGSAAATAHPVGGCPIGAATDLAGRVHGCPGLYVLDSSLIPGNVGGANPALTVSALAERAMDQIVQAGG